ncbi:MAG TPA: hypothetical protein VFQ30_15585, partial [Ktedonobacteraceae bacterium]|nr:hypothetical protein [Ktedonobacteraceae bacterium]
LSAADWAERKYWNDYQDAYEGALSRCSTDEAPWYIVPANRKWYRNLLVARTLVSTLRPYKEEWQARVVKRGERELARLEKVQQTANQPVEANTVLRSELKRSPENGLATSPELTSETSS